ncbi:hypothetical protein [Streptosporangium roseum]|uniref:hypothetical protein n=1 Tax=Streptosporangium roseum TaxID=2001 RepID=UPI00332ADC35
MAWGGSGWYADMLVDALGTSQLGINLDLDTYKLALYDNSISPDFTVADATYATTGEIAGTGYTAGGKAVTGTTLTVAGAFMVWDGDNVEWTSSTLTGVRGGQIYADPLSPKRLVIGIDWGSAYSTADGSLLVAWASQGIGRISCIP